MWEACLGIQEHLGAIRGPWLVNGIKNLLFALPIYVNKTNTSTKGRKQH